MYCTPIWNPHFGKDINVLEKVIEEPFISTQPMNLNLNLHSQALTVMTKR